MRPIKFRGYNAWKNEWRHGFYLQDRGAHLIVPDMLAPASDALPYEVVPESIGQFTGLKDKNGKNIYEGDIIGVKGIPERIEVRFVRGVFAFLWGGDLDDELPTGSPTHEWAVVIGNMFEHPELLRRGKQNKE